MKILTFPANPRIPQLRSIVAVVSAATTFACQTWKPVTLNENPDPAARPSRIEITSRGGSTSIVYSPVVRGDSLYGWQDRERTVPAAYAVADITTARTRQLSGGRTAALVAGTIVALAVLWAIFVITLISAIE